MYLTAANGKHLKKMWRAMLCRALPKHFWLCFCAFGVTIMYHVSSDFSYHTKYKHFLTGTDKKTKKMRKKKHKLAFCFSTNWKSIEIHPPWKTVTFSRSLPMTRNKLCQRTDWHLESRRLFGVECKGSTEHVFMFSAAVAAAVWMCVRAFMYLSDQGHRLLWAAQPEGPVGIAW